MKHSFFTSGRAVVNPDVQHLARKALAQFKNVTLSNFFERGEGDIEQDIYRLDFDAQEVYYRALKEGRKDILGETKNPDAKKLWVRYQLANCELDLSDPRSAELLRQYAIYRYGGKLQLVRTIRDPHDPENFHPKLSEMMRELNRLRDDAEARGHSEDLKLLDSLEKFYRASEIFRVAGPDLVPGLERSAA